MARITKAKAARAGHKIFKTSGGLEYTSTKLAFRPPELKRQVVEYKGHKMYVVVGPGMVLNPRRIFKKYWKKYREEQRALGRFFPEKPPL